MVRHILLIVMFTLVLPQNAAAQADSTYQQPLPSLTKSYYEGITFLSHNYNYELLNKQRALKSRSNTILTAGIIVAVGSCAAMAFIGEQNHWSTFATVSCGMVVTGAVIVPTMLWSNHLRKKANLIQVETAYFLPIGKHSELGAAVFSKGEQFGDKAIGIGFKTTF